MSRPATPGVQLPLVAVEIHDLYFVRAMDPSTKRTTTRMRPQLATRITW
jgi:hypothetical protein